jgi:hypothetical protein
MKQAHPLQILGAPAATGGTIACPSCSGQAQVNEDGSLLCPTELRFFEPEASCPADSAFFEMRQKFDAANGIDVSVRLLVPVNAAIGVAFNFRHAAARPLPPNALAVLAAGTKISAN